MRRVWGKARFREKAGRWVEYKDIWNYDAAMVPPSWHGWLCHVHDEPGDKTEEYLENKVKAAVQVDTSGDEIYKHHVSLKPRYFSLR